MHENQFFFFINQTEILFSGVSAQCNLALSVPIPECPQELLNLLGGSEFYTVQNETIMDILCREPCPPALETYRQNVQEACANDPQPRAGYPATYWVDAVSSVQRQMCLKDSATGTYCTQFLEQTLGDATDPQDLLGGYTTEQLCSECIVALFTHQQSTPYSNYDIEMANAWAEIQARCNLEYPTATPTLETNVTSLGNYAPSGYATAACVGGRTHEVISGDNCIDISKASRVSTGSLITFNSLRMDCTNLLLGQTLCLPPECDDYVVQSGDTCIDIAAKFSGISYQQIVAWNPTINPYCTNLLVGHNICVGPPGGIANFTTVPGATATQTDLYATETASRPTPVAEGTTTKCGKYYLVQPVNAPCLHSNIQTPFGLRQNVLTRNAGRLLRDHRTQSNSLAGDVPSHEPPDRRRMQQPALRLQLLRTADARLGCDNDIACCATANVHSAGHDDGVL